MMLDQDTKHAVTQMRENNAVWILKDSDGCVMLTTEDEDGVPVWSSQELALAWASEEWSECTAMSIDIETWRKKWTSGLTQDHLTVMVNPSEFQQEGIVMAPDDFEKAL